MSLKVIESLCIGCGACDFSCPTGALHKTETFLGLFEIDPFTCNDCGDCVPKCPERAIVVDPTWSGQLTGSQLAVPQATGQDKPVLLHLFFGRGW